jgi:hypothetical protein
MTTNYNTTFTSPTTEQYASVKRGYNLFCHLYEQNEFQSGAIFDALDPEHNLNNRKSTGIEWFMGDVKFIDDLKQIHLTGNIHNTRVNKLHDKLHEQGWQVVSQ